jgi:steroid delta-isomerase-like uncharacterized protein
MVFYFFSPPKGGLEMKQQNLHFVVLVILMGLLIGCKPSQMSQTETNKNVVNRFNEALNNGNFDLFDELLTSDFVRHCQATSDVQVRSPEDYKRFNQQFVTTFPDARTTIHFLVAEGDMVAAYATLTGTQKGSFGSLPASGKKIKSDFISIFRMENGKIAELWVEWDNLAILTQLGHFPPPAKGEE